MNIANICTNISRNAEKKIFRSVLINVLMLFQVNITCIDWNTQKWWKNIWNWYFIPKSVEIILLFSKYCADLKKESNKYEKKKIEENINKR